MNLPKNFEWINNIGQLPKVIIEGILLLGVKEIPGAKSNPIILKMAEDIGVKKIYTNDDTAWCAVAHNAVCLRAGKKIFGHDSPYDLLRAKSFLDNGVEFNQDGWKVIKMGAEEFGDTLVFSRPSGYHIGFYIGESDTHYFVMGGNQSNEYSFTRISKNRLVGVRRPVYRIAEPESVKKYYLSNDGVPVSDNES